MAAQRSMLAFAPGKELQRMIDQRVKQQGITVSEYLREAVLLELCFSGDLEATKFVVKRVGKRMKDLLVDKIQQVDMAHQLEVLAE